MLQHIGVTLCNLFNPLAMYCITPSRIDKWSTTHSLHCNVCDYLRLKNGSVIPAEFKSSETFLFLFPQQSFGFVGPLNFKLRRSLTKLRKEAETIKEILNMVANVYEPPNLEEGRLTSLSYTTLLPASVEGLFCYVFSCMRCMLSHCHRLSLALVCCHIVTDCHLL